MQRIQKQKARARHPETKANAIDWQTHSNFKNRKQKHKPYIGNKQQEPESNKQAKAINQQQSRASNSETKRNRQQSQKQHARFKKSKTKSNGKTSKNKKHG